ncbi:MAG: flavodoxin family protein [Bacteroidales bacterium]|jgi:flavodoxin|nr:flavodoxin family protein [Bacteroidales bacterium]
MNKIIIALTAILMVNSGCAQTQKTEKSENQSRKILIAYYSWGGKTMNVAQQIQSLTGGEIFEIKPVKPYPESYDECTRQAKKEIGDGYKPELNGNVEKIEQYDIIFIGSPNWWSTIAPPVTTFLTSYNLSGKIIIPFCTHGGGGKANLFKDIAKLCPDAEIKNGFAISGSSATTAKPEIQKWLQELEIIK